MMVIAIVLTALGTIYVLSLVGIRKAYLSKMKELQKDEGRS